MVNLTRIYTRTGDDGTTSLGDFSRTSKTDSRLMAYADVDEANSSLGLALAIGEFTDEVRALLGRIQNELFDVGADLCTPVNDSPEASEMEQLRVLPSYTEALEHDCDHFNASLEPLRSFILPGGSPGSAALQISRGIVRRAERSTWTALEEHGPTMNAEPVRYLNRLSDLLFILARVANDGQDVLWQPGSQRQGRPTTE